MLTMKKIFLLSLLFVGVISYAQETTLLKSYKTSILVNGECNMCQARINKAALKTKGVKYAFWQPSTKKLSLIIDQRKTSVKKVSEAIAKVGHDTELDLAKEEDYNTLHYCCRYRKE